MTTADPTHELATGGNVKQFSAASPNNAGMPAGQSPTPALIVFPGIICIAYIALLMIWSMQTNPQPYYTGNTLHGFTTFNFTWLTIPGILLAPIPAIALAHAIMRNTVPHTALARNSEWRFHLGASAVTALLVATFLTFLPYLSTMSSSDPKELSNGGNTWISETLHIKAITFPDKNGTAHAITTDGRNLTFDYKTTPHGYTLTLNKPATSTAVTDTPDFQLPGTTGTVHTKDAQGKPLTYTYTRDKNGHYTITTH